MFASVRGEIECEAAAARRRSHYVAWAARAQANRLQRRCSKWLPRANVRTMNLRELKTLLLNSYSCRKLADSVRVGTRTVIYANSSSNATSLLRLSTIEQGSHKYKSSFNNI